MSQDESLNMQAQTRGERENGGHSCLSLDEAGCGVFISFESESATMYATQEEK